MAEWICESCIYYPPSSGDGKPCSVCDPDEPLMSCYQKKGRNTKDADSVAAKDEKRGKR